MAKITLIMPAYNAEAWLTESIRSVLEQRFRDFTLLVVNDGSTDRTSAILEELAAQDARVRPLTGPNGGPAKARNLALDHLDADTEYVMFLDSDDRLLPDALDYALQGAARGAELTIFGFTIEELGGGTRDYCEPEQLLDRESLGAALGRLYKANLLNQVWGKLYSAELLREHAIRFPDYRWGEDRLFVFAYLEHCERICVLPDCKYRYVMHEGESLISRYYDKKFAVCLETDSRMQSLCRRFGVKDDADMRYMFLKSVFSCLTTLFSPSCPLRYGEKRAEVRRILANGQLQKRSRRAAGGLPTRVLAWVLRTGNVSLVMLCFRFVAWVGKTAPGLFMKIKHRK